MDRNPFNTVPYDEVSGGGEHCLEMSLTSAFRSLASCIQFTQPCSGSSYLLAGFASRD